MLASTPGSGSAFSCYAQGQLMGSTYTGLAAQLIAGQSLTHPRRKSTEQVMQFKRSVFIFFILTT